jgi:hypothetical protein
MKHPFASTLKTFAMPSCKTAALTLTPCVGVQGVAGATEDWSSITDGTVVLFRHDLAPGGGDPPSHTLNSSPGE